MDFVTTIIAILATIPYISFFIIFIILKKTTKQATRSTKIAADLSNVFFILAVNAILFIIFDYSFLTWTIITYMIAILFVITIQWRKDLEVNIWMAARLVWRAGFVLLAISYLLLLPIGIWVNF
ncbi:DUF3397 family protein [Aquisalibacillus elongatus]|uniref:Uncharacterized protein DUF3397 n=1 Tax=Aquisalibacillus elongatus TaxID=485577 RepID=A0A3N5BLN4_9BACI|nr:DUF3397 family protein [Aquisalibacillus elongatus]RPF56090.1 uncharacterized protein DUF3397 [Aquisalibacillus elongatus]